MDRNLDDFSHRVLRIRKARAKGYGFEATGTLGRKHYQPRKRRRIPVMGPVLIVVAVVIVLKAAIMTQTGAESYQERVDRLWQGGALAQVGAVLMQPDVLSRWVAGWLPRF